MRRSKLVEPDNQYQRRSESLDVITMEDLMESRYPLGHDPQLGEWAFRVVTSFGCPRHELGILLFRLRDDGQIGVRLE